MSEDPSRRRFGRGEDGEDLPRPGWQGSGSGGEGRASETDRAYRPDQWDQAPHGPYRPQDRPRGEFQADGEPYGERSRARFAGSGGGYGEYNWHEELSPGGRPRAMWNQDGLYRSGAPGPFVGKGPKGHQRSDARILESVNEALEDAGDVDASEVEVRVESGEVTLEGTVTDRTSKRAAEDAVQDLPGVRQVHNWLRVASPTP